MARAVLDFSSKDIDEDGSADMRRHQNGFSERSLSAGDEPPAAFYQRGVGP